MISTGWRGKDFPKPLARTKTLDRSEPNDSLSLLPKRRRAALMGFAGRRISIKFTPKVHSTCPENTFPARLVSIWDLSPTRILKPTPELFLSYAL